MAEKAWKYIVHSADCCPCAVACGGACAETVFRC